MREAAHLGKRAIAASTAGMANPTNAPDDQQPHPVPKRQTAADAGHSVAADTQIRDDGMLEGYRRSIDNIDAALIYMLAERFRITQAVGEYKARREMPAADPARERSQIERLRLLAEEADLDPEFSEKFIRFVIDEVIRHHQRARQTAS